MKSKFMMLVVLAVCSVGYAGIGDVSTDLLHQWSFEGNADDSIGTNHGTLIGTAAITATGGVDNSGYVSVGPGSNYVNLQDTAGLAEWTITAWVNNANTVSYAALAAGWEADLSWNDVRLGQHGTDGKSELGLTDSVTNQNGNYAGATINGVIGWTHLVITGGATDSTLYINGASQGVLTYANFVNGEDVAMTFLLSYDRLGAMGEYEGYGNGAFDLDEVGIWGRNLRTDEIAWLYNGGAGNAIGGDGGVDFADFAIFASNWLRSDCIEANQWCDGSDFNGDKSVDEFDLREFAAGWLADK